MEAIAEISKKIHIDKLHAMFHIKILYNTHTHYRNRAYIMLFVLS